MERVLAVCRHFKVPALVCINRFDLNEANTSRIEEYCRSNEVPVAGKVPRDRAVTEAMIEGVPVVEYSDGEVSRRIKETWEHIKKI